MTLAHIEVLATMADLAVGQLVKVVMPRGKNARGVEGVHVMYATSQEAKCDGAVGEITDIRPNGSHGIPLYLVDFTKAENAWMPPYSSYWIRADWLLPVKPAESAAPATN